MNPIALAALAVLSATTDNPVVIGTTDNPVVTGTTETPVVTGTTVNQASVAFSSSTISITRTSGPLDFGIGDCQNDTITTFTATFSTPVPSNSTLAIFLSDSSICATTAPSGRSRSVTDINNTLALSVSARDVVGLGSTCPSDKIQKSVCVLATSSSAVSSVASLTLTFHGEPPDAPTLKEAQGGDSVAHLKWNTAGIINHVTIYYRALNSGSSSDVDPCDPPAIVGFDAGLSQVAGTGDAGSADAGDGGTADAGFDTSLFTSVDSKSTSGGIVKGLENGATYLFFTVAVDAFGNTSGQSNALTATPQTVQDFYRRYRCENGQEKGGFGCTTAGAAALVPAFGALAYALLRRRGGRRS